MNHPSRKFFPAERAEVAEKETNDFAFGRLLKNSARTVQRHSWASGNPAFSNYYGLPSSPE